MELSCDSIRLQEDRRPTSCKFVELHVLYVPDEQWDVKLNKVPAEAIDSFISAGFIRVYPDITLRSLRGELGALLGADRSIDRFSFLKCVGRSLAVVKSKQEKDLKVKTFAPPYAPQPELYLLPLVENDSSVCSQSVTTDTRSSSPDQPGYYAPKTSSLPTGTKEPIKFPLILQSSQQSPPTPSLEEDEEEEDDEGDSYSSSEGEDEEEEGEDREEGEAVRSDKPVWAEQGSGPRKSQNQRAPQNVSHSKVDSVQVKESADKEETGTRKKAALREARDPECVEDRDVGVSIAKDRAVRNKDPQTGTKNRAMCGVMDATECVSDRHALVFSLQPATRPHEFGCSGNTLATEAPAGHPWPGPGPSSSAPPAGLDLAVVMHKAAGAQMFHTNRERLVEEIKLVREERKRLEWTRQELLRKGKDLLAQNRHRRNQARDSWKKKYFETKKATAPLEETLKSLRQELEMFYNKLLHQLQARDSRGKPRQQNRSSAKNELIIQIMTESHEIDNLKRKVEDARMKLTTEIKLRKQAATELRALKAELAQKRSQSSHPGHGISLSFGTRDRTHLQGATM